MTANKTVNAIHAKNALKMSVVKHVNIGYGHINQINTNKIPESCLSESEI